MLNQRRILVISLLSLVSFLLIALFKDNFTMIDSGVNLWAATIHTSSFTFVAVIVAYVFDTTILLAASILAAAYLFYKNYWKYSVLLLSGMGGDAAIISITKTLIHSARPLNGMLYDAGFSFPSGHAAGSIVFCGMLAYFAWRHWKSAKAKLSSNILFVVITSVVGFDRIYLGVHWFSDVLGGFLLGIFWLTFCLFIFQHLETIKNSNKRLPVKSNTLSLRLNLNFTHLRNPLRKLRLASLSRRFVFLCHFLKFEQRFSIFPYLMERMPILLKPETMVSISRLKLLSLKMEGSFMFTYLGALGSASAAKRVFDNAFGASVNAVTAQDAL